MFVMRRSSIKIWRWRGPELHTGTTAPLSTHLSRSAFYSSSITDWSKFQFTKTISILTTFYPHNWLFYTRRWVWLDLISTWDTPWAATVTVASSRQTFGLFGYVYTARMAHMQNRFVYCATACLNMFFLLTWGVVPGKKCTPEFQILRSVYFHVSKLVQTLSRWTWLACLEKSGWNLHRH